ncbi:MAG: hypothetical protein CVT99_08735 [Bacteroidetes bacterium HGW-Bacteroidetes-16]|jgi:hypothetical protein|nr:MAG: hypothetical protein CVT99_08735 [Bacteroidetes bacterium HGW-Bacteroidetes-16]
MADRRMDSFKISVIKKTISFIKLLNLIQSDAGSGQTGMLAFAKPGIPYDENYKSVLIRA